MSTSVRVGLSRYQPRGFTIFHSFCQQIFSDSSFQQRVKLKHPFIVGGGIGYLTFLGLFQAASDLFHGAEFRLLSILQFAAQVSSPLFLAVLQSPGILPAIRPETIQQILCVGFPLHGAFHKERMQVILRRLRGILLFPFLEKVEVFA